MLLFSCAARKSILLQLSWADCGSTCTVRGSGAHAGFSLCGTEGAPPDVLLLLLMMLQLFPVPQLEWDSGLGPQWGGWSPGANGGRIQGCCCSQRQPWFVVVVRGWQWSSAPDTGSGGLWLMVVVCGLL